MDIYSQEMRDRSMRSGTELAQEIKLTDWSMAGNLSNRSSGVQIPRDICTRLKRYLYSAKCSWIIKNEIESYKHVHIGYSQAQFRHYASAVPKKLNSEIIKFNKEHGRRTASQSNN